MIRSLLPRLLKRSGVRLLLAFGSLVLGALTLATVLGLIGSVQDFFITQSRALLGGDITISADAPIDLAPQLRSELGLRGIQFSERMDTLVVARTLTPETTNRLSSLLISLKVVDEAYPLYGVLETTDAGVKSPNKDEVFIAPDILARMGVTAGDKLVIGNEEFTIRTVITSEPDRVGGSFRLGPLAIISKEGWQRSGIDGKQSRIDHSLALRFPENITLAESAIITKSVKDAFPQPTYRVATAEEGPNTLLRILDSAERFFFTMIVLALFLVIVNIRLNLVYFLASFQKTIAIMRSLGMRKKQLLTLFLSLLFLMALLAGVVGTLLGNIVANSALPFAEKFIEVPLSEILIYSNISLVTLFTILLCIFSALGFLVRVLAIEPKMLLLGYGSEHGHASLLIKELPTLLITLLGLYGGVYYLTERALVALIAVGSITAVFALLFVLARGLIMVGHRMRFSLPFQLRSIMNFLKHQGMVGTTAIASLTIALATIFSITLIEANVLGNLNEEFRRDAPNIYLIDVQEDQLPEVRSIMGDTWRDFSMIRARFTERNGYDIQSNLATEDGEMRREFNITSRAELIEGEELIEGVWHGTSGQNQVSIEKDFAQRAKLKIGTKVQFVTQGVPLEATVTSIRTVNTTSGLPFFFLVFSPDVLSGIPRTSFGYAFVSEDTIPDLQNQLAIKYPNISSIPTTQILETVARVVGVLGAAVAGTVIPALVLGLILIIAMLGLSARERANDMLVFTAFGARTRLLFSLFLIESSAVVLIAGAFAGAIAHLGVYGLNWFVFDFKGFYFSPLVLYLFLGILFTTVIIALFYAKRFTSQSPAKLLGKEGRG